MIIFYLIFSIFFSRSYPHESLMNNQSLMIFPDFKIIMHILHMPSRSARQFPCMRYSEFRF